MSKRHCHCGVTLYDGEDCSPCSDYVCEVCYPEEARAINEEQRSIEVNRIIAKSGE